MDENLDLDHVHELVDELDLAVPRDGAWLREGESESGSSLITANRCGFFRLGIEFLKTALAETPEGDERFPEGHVEVDLEYLAGQDVCYEFVRSEEPLDEAAPAATLGLLGTVLSVSLVLLFFATLAVGMITILLWVIGLVF